MDKFELVDTFELEACSGGKINWWQVIGEGLGGALVGSLGGPWGALGGGIIGIGGAIIDGL